VTGPRLRRCAWRTPIPYRPSRCSRPQSRQQNRLQLRRFLLPPFLDGVQLRLLLPHQRQRMIQNLLQSQTARNTATCRTFRRSSHTLTTCKILFHFRFLPSPRPMRHRLRLMRQLHLRSLPRYRRRNLLQPLSPSTKMATDTTPATFRTCRWETHFFATRNRRPPLQPLASTR
jgi:hypothetical protein